MAFYGSIFGNETSWNRRPTGHARHIACPQRLKYIHNIKDGYIPCVEDSEYINRTSYRNGLQKTNHLGLYNTADVWRQELMGLAQQVQSSLQLFDESRSSLLSQRSSKRSSSSLPISYLQDNDESNISKRLLNRHASPQRQHSYIPKLRISIDENEQESSINNKKQDPGIWLLPILCYILQVDNILDAQEWLVNANPTEKRLAMEVISRKMQDMQNHENVFISNLSTGDQSSTSSNLNNLYWPYKFWQCQQQSKISANTNDTCERATSPVRILTPAKRLSISSISSRSNQTPQTRLSTPMTANSNDRPSRRGHRVTTSRNTFDHQSKSANIRGKTPLI